MIMMTCSIATFFWYLLGRIVDPDQDPLIDDQFAAQIGIVWPKPLIQRIVTEGRPDQFRRENAFEMTVEAIHIDLNGMQGTER
jgi:hypothetical protein